jgi:hypothetical protein
MKSLWKLTAVAALALGGSLAQADVVPSNTATGSELVLFVRDTSPGANPNRVYARGLGLTVDSVLTQAAAGGAYSGPGTAIPFNIGSIGPDANLTAFLGSGTSFVWTVMAGDSLGTAAFNQRYVTTTQIDATASGFTTPGNSTLRTVWSQINAFLNDLNGILPDASGSSTATDGEWGQTGGAYENATDWFAGGMNNVNDLGQAANLYALANSSTVNTASSRLFAGVRVVLDADGTLHAVAVTAPVPVPPALYLLGSAIAGLTGVARRKKAKAA